MITSTDDTSSDGPREQLSSIHGDNINTNISVWMCKLNMSEQYVYNNAVKLC